MKRLLLLLSLFGSLYVNAQSSCATAVAITTNGTITATTITGTYGNSCWGGTLNSANVALKSRWYSYTATANGEVVVSSNLPANVAPNSTDTRLSIFKGTCAVLECYDGNDDVSSTNYLSNITFPVESGTTYYIAWDNNWSAAGFQFSFAFTASSCIRPSLFSVNDPASVTASSANLSWDAAIGNPSGYDIEYGAIGHVAGSGTIVNTLTTSTSLSLLPSGADLTYYLRSNCGATQSSWVGPFNLYLAKQTPYSNNFDDATDNDDGFTFSGWGLSTSATNAQFAHSGSSFIFSNTSITAVSDAYAFFRPMYLAMGESITINFQARLLGAAPNTASLNVTVGNTPMAASQSLVQSFTGITPGAYSLKTVTWTAPAAGVYYFGLRNVSPIGTAVSNLLVDTITTTSVLGVNEYLASQVSVFPNPTKGTISLSNNTNILMNLVVISDLNGRTIKTIELNDVSNTQIDISDLSSGMYLMNIASDQGSLTKKIIKN